MRNRIKIVRLVSRLLDDEISEDESQELRKLLNESEEARETYRKVVANEATLAQSLGAAREGKIIKRKNSFWRKPSSWAAVAAVLIGAVLYQSGSGWIQPIFERGEKVAFLRNGENPVRLLTTGNYHLKSGEYLIDFFSGAQVKLVGPAKFEIVSPMHMHFEQGRLVANMNRTSKFFKITNQKSAFVDLGTEFAINMDDSNSGELMVYQGEVIANTFSDQGATERVTSVETDQQVRFNQSTNRFDPVSDESIDFLTFEEPFDSKLLEVGELQRLIIAAEPSYYWSFDHSLVDSTEQFEFLKSGNCISNVVDRNNGALRFDHDVNFHQLELEQELSFSANQPFSIEFLFRTERIGRATMVSLFKKDSMRPNGSADHFVLIETMAQPTEFLHIPACIRTVYRPIAGTSSQVGINSFSSEHCVPGKWTHFVLTFDGHTLRAYQNSRLQTETMLSPEDRSENGVYALVLGQMASFNSQSQTRGGIQPPGQYRPYVGMMDELAIYDRALAKNEIQARAHSVGL